MSIKLTPDEAKWPPVLKDPDQVSGSSCEPGQLVYTFSVVCHVTVAAKDIHQAKRELEQIRSAGRFIIGDAKLCFSAAAVSCPDSVYVYNPHTGETVPRP